MYEIARQHPSWMRHADTAEYLRRARTAPPGPYFELQGQIDFLPPDRNPYWAYTLGMYNEVSIELVCDALAREGLQAEARWLRGEWEKKILYFVYDDPYPFDSEMPFDTTAFESTYAFARYGLERTALPADAGWYDWKRQAWHVYPKVAREDFESFLHRQARANVASRGWLEPAFYLMGSDNRRGDATLYALSYMSQAGGWPLIEYGAHYARETYALVNLGYASLLSSWALMNAGTPESHFGQRRGASCQSDQMSWAGFARAGKPNAERTSCSKRSTSSSDSSRKRRFLLPLAR